MDIPKVQYTLKFLFAHGILQFTMLITLRCAVLHVSCIVVRAPCEPFLWIAASAFLCKCITKDGKAEDNNFTVFVFVHATKNCHAVLCCAVLCTQPNSVSCTETKTAVLCCAVLCCPVLYNTAQTLYLFA